MSAPTHAELVERAATWLLPRIRHRTAHAYHDYLKSSLGPFLSAIAACGAHRDPRLRIPADELGDRKCKSCLKNVERDARRKRELEAAYETYGIKGPSNGG